MFEILNFYKNKDSWADISNPDIPPPVDTSKVVLVQGEESYIVGQEINDYLGNQYQFNYDGSKLLTPSYTRNNTELRTRIGDSTRYTVDKVLDIKFGAAGSDDFSVIHTFSTAAEQAVYIRDSDGEYAKHETPVATRSFDNWQISSTGNYFSDKTGVYRLNKDTGAITKILTHAGQGFIFSENEKIAVSFDDFNIISRWSVDGDKMELITTNTLSKPISIPIASNGGLEVGYNYNLDRIVYLTNDYGATFLVYDHIGKLYYVKQTFTQLKGTNTMSISMDRAGTMFTYSFGMAMTTLPVYQYNNATGKFVQVLTIPLIKNGNVWAHKVKLSPNGQLLGIDEIYYQTSLGRIRVMKLYN